MSVDDSSVHFNRTPRRKASFIMPINHLRQKVGFGGLNDEVLDEADGLINNNTVDFSPIAENYLKNLMVAIEKAKSSNEPEQDEALIAQMLFPAVQLKANGGMFHYPLISRISDRLVQFLEVIDAPEIEAVEIILAFHTTMMAVICGNVTGASGAHGESLMKALDGACMRYFEKQIVFE